MGMRPDKPIPIPDAWAIYEPESDPPGMGMLPRMPDFDDARREPQVRLPTRAEAWALYWPRADVGREQPDLWPAVLGYTDERLSSIRQTSAMKRAADRRLADGMFSEPVAAPEPDPEALSRDWRRSGPKTQQHVVADPVYDRATAALVAALVAGLNERFLRFKLPLPVGLPELRQVFARILDDEAAVQALSSLRGEAPTTERAPSPTVVAALPKTPRDRLTARLWLARYAFVSLAETADWTDADLDEAGEIVTAMMDAEDDDERAVTIVNNMAPDTAAQIERMAQIERAKERYREQVRGHMTPEQVDAAIKRADQTSEPHGDAPSPWAHRKVGHAQAAREREEIAAMVWEGPGALPDDPLPARVREILVDLSIALEEIRNLRAENERLREASAQILQVVGEGNLHERSGDASPVVGRVRHEVTNLRSCVAGMYATAPAHPRLFWPKVDPEDQAVPAPADVRTLRISATIDNGPEAPRLVRYGFDASPIGEYDGGRFYALMATSRDFVPKEHAPQQVGPEPPLWEQLVGVLRRAGKTGHVREVDGKAAIIVDEPRAYFEVTTGAPVQQVAPRHTVAAAEFGWEQVDGIRRAQVVTERQVVHVLSLIGSTDGMSRASASVVIQDGPPSTIDLIALAPGQSFDLTDWTYIECWWIEDRYDVFARIRPAAG